MAKMVFHCASRPGSPAAASPQPADEQYNAARSAPRICVVGPGAIGGTLAVAMESAGAVVSTLCPSNRAADIQQNGLAVHSGEIRRTWPRATADALELGSQDCVLVCVKGDALQQIAHQIQPLCGSQTHLVFAMNGLPWWFLNRSHPALRLATLDPGERLANSIPLERVAWAVVHFSAHRRGDGEIVVSRPGPLVIGRPDGNADALQSIASLLQASGLSVEVATDIYQAIWSKLVLNAVVNPLSALTMSIPKAIHDDPLLRELAAALIGEANQIGRALGLPEVEGLLGWMRQAGMKTSMLQDLEHGRRLELNVILEPLVELGEKLRVPLPHFRTILGLARERARMVSAAA